jgi:hypothetical protein
VLVRGGAWNNNRNNARCAYRNNNHPDNRNNNLGFRVVLRSSHVLPVLSLAAAALQGRLRWRPQGAPGCHVCSSKCGVPRTLRATPPRRRRKNSARQVRPEVHAARHGPPRVRAGAEGT